MSIHAFCCIEPSKRCLPTYSHLVHTSIGIQESWIIERNGGGGGNKVVVMSLEIVNKHTTYVLGSQ